MNLNFIDETFNSPLSTKFHLYSQQRNGRKSITIVEFPDGCDIQANKFLEYVRPKLCCNGSLINDGNGILLQGDHRDAIGKILREKMGVKSQDIIKHGY